MRESLLRMATWVGNLVVSPWVAALPPTRN